MMEARFWVSAGVEVAGCTVVPTPPPREYRLAIMTPWSIDWRAEDFTPTDIVPVQDACFRLSNWSPSGGVAHYDLDSKPPKGWRWLVVGGKLQAERV